MGDSGAKLSGGQRQRIAIARSIVRKPKILILDEATSAIDVRGERIVQAALDKVAQGRTTITIAHRLSTIKKADRIIVLKKGQLVESGTHNELLDREGVYYGLVQAQQLSLGEPAEASKEMSESIDEETSLTQEKSRAKSVTATAEDPEEVKDQQRGLFKSFGRFFYESRNVWWLKALTVLFTAGCGASLPLQAWIFAQSIDLFKFAGNRDKLMDEASFTSLMWTVLAICVGISYFGAFNSATRMSGIVRAKYQQEYFDSIMFQKASYFDEEDHSHGTLTSRLTDDPKQLEELMGGNMALVYVAIFSITGSVIIALVFAWKLALVSICVVLPVIISSSFWRMRYELQFDKMNNAVFAESSKFASESISAFRTVSSLTLEDTIAERFEKLCQSHVVSAYKKARWVSILFGFSDSSTMACQALIFWYGGRLMLDGEIELIAFFVCLMAIMNAGESSGQSLSFGPNAAQVTAASNRILNARATRIMDEPTTELAFPESEGGMKIELRNLGFKYPTREQPVFNGLNLTIEKGQFAALVGASGCGKTSIISLLERSVYSRNSIPALIFLETDTKADFTIWTAVRFCVTTRMSLMSTSLPTVITCRLLHRNQHCSKVSDLLGVSLTLNSFCWIHLVNLYLYLGTLRDNILLGIDNDTVTDEQLHKACRDASIHDFIVSLPDGYNTNIGSRGVSLSGGQKQRVSIARALIRNPQVLLLDEATSSLDSESEKLVQAAFERAGQGRTMVVVAHRLATVQNADVIFVLGEGKLLEKGNHTELLRKKGVYYQMVRESQQLFTLP